MSPVVYSVLVIWKSITYTLCDIILYMRLINHFCRLQFKHILIYPWFSSFSADAILHHWVSEFQQESDIPSKYWTDRKIIYTHFVSNNNLNIISEGTMSECVRMSGRFFKNVVWTATSCTARQGQEKYSRPQDTKQNDFFTHCADDILWDMKVCISLYVFAGKYSIILYDNTLCPLGYCSR